MIVKRAGQATCVSATSDGSVYIGTLKHRMIRHAGGVFAPFPIRCLHVTTDGALWIGFAGRGLGRIKDGRFLHVGTREGLLDNYVSQILSDDKGRLWLAGNRGLSYVALEAFEALAQGRAERVRTVAFGQGEGQPNLQATIGCGSSVWNMRTRSNGNGCGSRRISTMRWVPN